MIFCLGTSLDGEIVNAPVIKNHIAGKFLISEKQIEDTNPVNGSMVAMVAETDQEMVGNAVQAGRTALKRDWGSSSAEERSGLPHAVADGIETRYDDFVQAETA